MKPVNLNQLLSQPKSLSLSFFWPALGHEEKRLESFIQGLVFELNDEHPELAKILSKRKDSLFKIMKSHPDKAYGFFFSEKFDGYTALESMTNPFVTIKQSFHVRPLLEEFFLNPEFMLVNISQEEVKVFRGDFHHLDIIQQYDLDSHTNDHDRSNYFQPGKLGVISYKTSLTLKNLGKKIMDKTMYHSMPVIVTGPADLKKVFLKNYHHNFGVISHLDEDFGSKTCVEITKMAKILKPLVIDFYSASLRERLKKMMKSKRLVSDLDAIVKAVFEGKIVHLVLPSEKKLWGRVDFTTGLVELHKRIHKKNPSVDILNELAEEVIRQGGKIEILGDSFFPPDAEVIGILKGSA